MDLTILKNSDWEIMVLFGRENVGIDEFMVTCIICLKDYI